MTTIRDGFNDGAILGDDVPPPPARLFERLAQVPGYTWDQTVHPTNPVYRVECADNWNSSPHFTRATITGKGPLYGLPGVITDVGWQARIRATTQSRSRQYHISHP